MIGQDLGKGGRRNRVSRIINNTVNSVIITWPIRAGAAASAAHFVYRVAQKGSSHVACSTRPGREEESRNL